MRALCVKNSCILKHVMYNTSIQCISMYDDQKNISSFPNNYFF